MTEKQSSVETGMKLINDLDIEVVALQPTGSRYICDPPVLDTDEDYVILIDDDLQGMARELVRAGWDDGTGQYENAERRQSHEFVSLRKEHYNLILVNKLEEFEKWQMATEEAKRLNLLDKEERITLFNKYWEQGLYEVTKAEARIG